MNLVDEDLAISNWDEEWVTEYRRKTKEAANRAMYIRVQNVIKDAKIKKYVKESDSIAADRITFWGNFTGKNALQLERARNVKLRIELLQTEKIEHKDKYEPKDMMADLYACAISNLGGNFTNEMQKMYDKIKRTCTKEEAVTDEQVYLLACEKINGGQSFLPVIHQEKSKGIFGDIKNQVNFYKIENQKLENQIILERGKSQFGTFEYVGKNAGIIIPTSIKNNKKSLTNA
ncbi:MAG: hypothetical protein IJW20_00480 [Clostridia bacterium]|nr:hypothetical protein [Clostridia bacterium]